MNLITRCPACATMFKVVADQLKVAQGWVRCGHCGEVFDASLHLVPGDAAGFPDDLAEKPIDAPAGIPSLTPEPLDSALDARARKGEESISNALPVDSPPVEAPSMQMQPVDVPPVNTVSEPGMPTDPAFTTDAYGFAPSNLAEAEGVDSQAVAPEVPSSSAEEPEATPEVSFVREARRREVWKMPLVRALLGLISLMLLAALILQWVVRQKDVLAAQEPRLAPWLQALCRPLGCEIRPLRRIESIVIDSSSFSKTGPDSYRLIFVFKNTGAAALEIPALEVTLTDSQDQALVRRIVMPAQFGAAAATLGAHSELAGAVSLKVSRDGAQGASASTQARPLPVAGYRILAFYP